MNSVEIPNQVCFARWENDNLFLENAHFTARVLLDESGARVQFLEETLARDADTVGEWGTHSPVEAPSLRIYQSGEWKLFADVVGFQVRLAYAEKAQQDEKKQGVPTGIEEAPDEIATRDEAALRVVFPMCHARLIEVEFRDQTDIHNELVFERERLLQSNERVEPLRGNVWAVEDVFSGESLIFIKHDALPAMRPESTVDIGRDFHVVRDGENLECALFGRGAVVAVLCASEGKKGRIAALQNYQRALRVPQHGRDGLFLSNTWGDRSKDGAVSEEFMLREAEAAARLGVEVLQIDDGWQRGRTANSVEAGGIWESYWKTDANFWTPHAERFPRGLAPIKERCDELGLRFGLWFSPDSSDDFANWQRDADALLRLHREDGAHFFKLDGIKIRSRAGDENFRRMCQRVLEESKGAVTFDLDITAETRPGYWGIPEIGPLFLENRYTDWGRYFPHLTLRQLWKLAHWMPPARLRLEFLNVARHKDKYAGDVLAPSRYAPDYLFATVMLASPLGWFEVQNLPDEYFVRVAPLVALWKDHRAALINSTILPVGDAPDGTSWTGFVSDAGYALIFREFNTQSRCYLPAGEQWKNAHVLAGKGNATIENGVLCVEIPDAQNFVWLRLQ